MKRLPAYDEQDLRVLAQTVYGEARGETRNGKIAVAWVVVNRCLDKRWPNAVRKVCKQRAQFSCWNRGEANNWPMLVVDLEDANYRECLAVAAAVLGGLYQDPTIGSKHYYNDSIVRRTPSWARGKKPIGRIGNHVFFNDIR